MIGNPFFVPSQMIWRGDQSYPLLYWRRHHLRNPELWPLCYHDHQWQLRVGDMNSMFHWKKWSDKVRSTLWSGGKISTIIRGKSRTKKHKNVFNPRIKKPSWQHFFLWKRKCIFSTSGPKILLKHIYVKPFISKPIFFVENDCSTLI